MYMKKTFVKMNDNKNYLSLGNLFNIIKKHSKVSASAIQTELFCTLFNLNSVSNTRINNYLIGYRPISLEYKKIYYDLKKQYVVNKEIFINIIIKILNILDECYYKEEIDIINNNDSLNNVCIDLISIVDSDININREIYEKIKKLYYNNNFYEYFIEILFYSIFENKQPVYIENVEIDIKDIELKEYLNINLYEGISHISSLLELSKRENKYANSELGSLEFSGLISGSVDYEKSFLYYLKAANKNHPKACWMVANLILTNRVENKDINFAWNYLEKAVSLGSIAAINTIGNCYLNGKNKDGIIDEEKALEYYKRASEYSYPFSYNNIGLYYERKKEIENALKYFKLSADLGNSWALNKVGEYYRVKGDMKLAYFYYKKSSECPKSERNYYSYYNLAKYFYSVGNNDAGIEKDEVKAKKYFSEAKKYIDK